MNHSVSVDTELSNGSASVGMSTPWGTANIVEVLAPGIYSVTTSSHGGIYLDREHQDRIRAVRARNFLASLAWWEEDCDWSVPYALFASEIEKSNTPNHMQHLQIAMRIIFATHREVIGKFQAPRLR